MTTPALPQLLEDKEGAAGSTAAGAVVIDAFEEDVAREASSPSSSRS